MPVFANDEASSIAGRDDALRMIGDFADYRYPVAGTLDRLGEGCQAVLSGTDLGREVLAEEENMHNRPQTAD